MKRVPLQAKLYRDVDRHDCRVAWYANIGWVRFRASPSGPAEEDSETELDALQVRAVSLAQAFNNRPD